MADATRTRDELYEQVVATCRAALDRLVRAYEPDPDKRRAQYRDLSDPAEGEGSQAGGP